MTKEANVIRYYVLCNRLKNVVRTGWKTWNVKRDRLESVAEHIFGVQMLAIAMKSEFGYDIDIMKVLFMLAVHELEEIVIGDLTQFQITEEEKVKKGHEAVANILSSLLDREEIMALIIEFEERKTKEAIFAYYCDKLEGDLQSKLYDEEGCVDLNDQEGNELLNNLKVKALFEEGRCWSDAWLTFSQKAYNYDENFTAVSEYARTNDISIDEI